MANLEMKVTKLRLSYVDIILYEELGNILWEELGNIYLVSWKTISSSSFYTIVYSLSNKNNFFIGIFYLVWYGMLLWHHQPETYSLYIYDIYPQLETYGLYMNDIYC